MQAIGCGIYVAKGLRSTVCKSVLNATVFQANIYIILTSGKEQMALPTAELIGRDRHQTTQRTYYKT